MDRTKDQMDSNKVFGQGGKAGESDKLNIDSIIARLLEGKKHYPVMLRFFSENISPIRIL